MIASMERRANAKINWMLRITARRPDGYHDLETIFQTISLHDTLTFTPASLLSLECDDPAVPADETNLVMRAARSLAVDHVHIHLQKRVPGGGGLGGGSSDAATTLVALAPAGMSAAQLHERAIGLGSDVPFFLVGGTAYATGRGEELISLPTLSGVPLLLVLPEARMATGRAFGLLRQWSAPLGLERARSLVRDVHSLRRGELTNDFEGPVFAELPELQGLKDRLYQSGATFAAMSGSGSTLFGVFPIAAKRDAAAERFPDVRVERAETL